MTEHRIIGRIALRDEMMAVARGEKLTLDYAGKQNAGWTRISDHGTPSFEVRRGTVAY